MAHVSPLLSVSTTVRPHQVVLTVRGEIDPSTDPLLNRHIAEALARRPPVMVLDMRDVTFFGARALSIVLAAWRAAVQMDCQLVLRGLSATARRVVEAGGASGVLTVIADDVDASGLVSEGG